ncbi:MAG TPA: NUDIX hydrolase [Ktedonobacteraceae bacterium]|nr:NUDIX hydrolase [Ktedonobacteraceae bacterium]
MLYDLLKKCTSIFFNLLNKIMGGRLPPFGSVCVVVEKEGKFLVIELPHERTTFPGGFMSWNEKPRQSAEREGFEETGLILRATKLVGVYSHASAKMTQMSNVCFAYVAEVVGGELRQNKEGNPYWLDEAELHSRLAPVTLKILNDYQRQRQPQSKYLFFRPRPKQALESSLVDTGDDTLSLS